MNHPEGTETARIIELARSFPSIADHADVIDWNPDALAKWYAVASSGERLAVQFVLGVWNQFEQWPCGRFDVIEAFEPRRDPERCLLADHDEPDCSQTDACRLRRLFDEVEEMARCTYASVTLDTLVGLRGRADGALPVIR